GDVGVLNVNGDVDVLNDTTKGGVNRAGDAGEVVIGNGEIHRPAVVPHRAGMRRDVASIGHAVGVAVRRADDDIARIEDAVAVAVVNGQFARIRNPVAVAVVGAGGDFAYVDKAVGVAVQRK